MAMAIDLHTEAERVQKFFDELETQKTILSTCTQLFSTLSKHFTAIQDSITQRSQSIDSKFTSLESNAKETLQALSDRENSISQQKSAAIARIEKQKEAALLEFQSSNPPENLEDSLKSFCRKMDCSGLVKFIISKRKESISMRAEIAPAILEAVDPARLILDVLDEFLSDKMGKVGVTDKRWACLMLLQALFGENLQLGTKKGPQFSRSVVERAGKMLKLWKEMDGEEQGCGGVVGPAEAVMFLQMVVGFGLKSSFTEEFLTKLVVEHPSRRDMAKVFANLGLGEKKMTDIIDELVKNGKEIEGVYFASESGLTDRFPPISLLKSYLRNARKNATAILKNGNHGTSATEEASTVELNSIKAIIKCVEDHDLESNFCLESLRKRVSQLDKIKGERRKSSQAPVRAQNKRSHSSSSRSRGNGAPTQRPPKAARHPNAYSSFTRRNPVPAAHHSPVARYSGPYSYPSQNVYEAPSATPYTPSYVVPHNQSPSAVTQQHYSFSVDNAGSAAAYHDGGAYPPPAYQLSPYQQP